MSDDMKVFAFTKRDFIDFGGKVVLNNEKRPSVTFTGGQGGKLSPYSFLVGIHSEKILKDSKISHCDTHLKKMLPHQTFAIIDSTRFCSNCKRPSWCFLKFERKGHATCPGCGLVQKLRQNNFSLRLGEDGHANKSQWEHTPGMTSRDCYIHKKGKRTGKRFKSHWRNFLRINGKIEAIANDWHFMAMESLLRRSKSKLKRFYYIIHDDSVLDTDSEGKLPHGGAALAAACFYCAVLEFETRVGYKTPCTLPAIQEAAQGCRDIHRNRKCRVDNGKYNFVYAGILKKHGLCHVKIPEIGAETLRFHPKSAGLQHARMAIFSECSPMRVHLPTNEGWKMRIGNTGQGVLYINAVQVGGHAWEQGIRKGDYLFQIEHETMNIHCTPKVLEKHIHDLRKRLSKKPVIQLTLMRKKK